MAMDKKDAANKLLEKAKKLAGCPVDSQQWKDAFGELETAWSALRDATAKSTTTSIGEFFRSVGSGLIEAQKKLDIESENYVRSALQKGAAGPDATGAPSMASTFRIPRVNAELKCSLETDRERKLNLIFYSDRNDVRELHQQTVQLEIIAVPAPADYINYLKKAPPKTPTGPNPPSDDEAEEDSAGDLLADADGGINRVKTKPHIFSFEEPADDGEESLDIHLDSEPGRGLPAGWQGHLANEAAREDAKKLIEDLDRKANGLRRTLIKEHLLPAWNRAIIFTDGQDVRFIALAVPGKRPELLLWQLSVQPASLQLV
jgi:hypothetical protein